MNLTYLILCTCVCFSVLVNCRSTRSTDCGKCPTEKCAFPLCGGDGETYNSLCLLEVAECKSGELIHYLHDGKCITQPYQYVPTNKGPKCFNVVRDINAVGKIPESVDSNTTFYFGHVCNWNDCMNECAKAHGCAAWALYSTWDSRHCRCYGVSSEKTQKQRELDIISGIQTNCSSTDCGTCGFVDSDCGTCTSHNDSNCGTCTREDSGVCGRVEWIDKWYKNMCTLSVEGCKTNKFIQYLHDGDCIPRYVNVDLGTGKRCFNVLANNNALKIGLILQPDTVNNKTTFYFGDFCNWKDCMKQCAKEKKCFTWALYLTSGAQHKKCYGVSRENTEEGTDYIGLISGVLTGGKNGCGDGKLIDDLQNGTCIDW